jgi:hypothetical protein
VSDLQLRLVVVLLVQQELIRAQQIERLRMIG